MDQIPSFDQLPLNKSDPPYSAWGLYGRHDQLGFLNRLTEDVVVRAAKEIKTGVRVSLNWPLDAQAKPGFRRQAFHHGLLHKKPRAVFDDVWTMNSQSSSQWDGLRHFGYQASGQFYNGITADQIHPAPNSAPAPPDSLTSSSQPLSPPPPSTPKADPLDPRFAGTNGIHFWAERGIVGRGVLLDHVAWREHILATQSPSTSELAARLAKFDPHDSSAITVSDLHAIAAHQDFLTFQPADILIIRSGYIRAYGRMTPDQRAASATVPQGQPPKAAGLERSEAMLRLIWENFAAVAGDAPALEVWPPSTPGDGSLAQNKLLLHEVLLAGWGCPIGELWDLEALGAECARQRRWSFFLTSEPCAVTGGVASPPNALAIF